MQLPRKSIHHKAVRAPQICVRHIFCSGEAKLFAIVLLCWFPLVRCWNYLQRQIITRLRVLGLAPELSNVLLGIHYTQSGRGVASFSEVAILAACVDVVVESFAQIFLVVLSSIRTACGTVRAFGNINFVWIAHFTCEIPRFRLVSA